MSTESRLRSALTEAADGVVTTQVDTESMLERSLNDGGRRIKVRRFGAVVAFAAVFAAGALVGPKLFGLGEGAEPIKPAHSPLPSPSSQVSGADLGLFGRYEAQVARGTTLHLRGGRWTIAFLRSDRLHIEYPKPLPGSQDPIGSLADAYFSATENGLNLPSAAFHCSDAGEYTWIVLANGDLHLYERDDSCAFRVRVLTGRSWHPVPSEG